MHPRFTLKYTVAAMLLAGAAHAQTGVSDDRVSLPEGPGSQQGVGDNAIVNPNMGSMAYSVPIDVPAGFEGVTPNLALSYSSSGANGILGYGWSMAVPFIERMTNRGLPSYDADDLFVSDGGNQLVRVENGDVAVYRSRFEGSFTRYTWYDAGSAGYWTAETPDGNTLFFGADQNGVAEQDAQFRGRQGTFRYQLVAVVDRFGHRAEYSYQNVDGVPYLDAIRYTFTAGDAASTVRFGYAGRDDIVSDARSGSNELMSQRLAAVEVFAGETRIWRYDVTYEGYDVSNGQSRVSQINRVGLDNTPDPVVFGFEYSKTLGGACDADCQAPFLVDMGDLGVSLGAGNATLIDINGDALPDVVDTSLVGMHRFFINRLDPAGEHAFDVPYRSEVGDQSGHQLSSPYVQVLDVNGDGRADIVNALTGDVLHNMGGGDWEAAPEIGDNTLPDFGEDFAVGAEELTSVRFLDYDMDKRIDVLLSRDQTTQVWRNGAAGFVLDETVESIGAGFSDTRLQMADMNGDGLQDPVILASGSLRWRMNLGWGQWSAWREIENLPFNEAELDFVELEDINGDGMDDVVLVLADSLRYALNRGGDRFDPPQTIDAAGGRALPTRTADTTVLYADMNGSGSDDVVWITSGGEVTYLELFPIRPNLLSRITNGLGMVTDVTYTTSASEQAADQTEWAHSLPFPMLMVSSLDTFDAMSDLHQIVRYSYHSGYYDTEEKTFRGFSQVELLNEGDESQRSAHMAQIYDVGDGDTYRNGLMLSQQISGISDDGNTLTPLRNSTYAFEDCPLTGIPENLDYPVRFICATTDEVVIQEGADSADWVTTRNERSYDGYGNVITESALGVIGIGDAGCPQVDRPEGVFGAPSGPDCAGDERYTETAFVDPEHTGGIWLLGSAFRVRSFAADGADYAERLTYFDGDGFIGEALGSLTTGLPTRISDRVDDGQTIQSVRSAYDAHGNLIEQIDPRGTVGEPGFRTRWTYDAESLLVVQTERENIDSDGTPYVMRRRTTHNGTWGVPSERTNWVTVVGGAAINPVERTQYAYDGLGRMIASAEAGDTLDRPTTEYSHQHGAPPNRTITRSRSVAGSRLPDLETIHCFDGFGRLYQTRVLVRPGRYEVSGFMVFSRRGQPVARHRAYTDDSADCDINPPATPVITYQLDAMGRTLSSVRPDAALFEGASTTRMQYTPLAELTYDAEDTDADGPFFNTPQLRRYDGLGRVIEVELVQDADAPGAVYQLGYDSFSGLSWLRGPAGDTRTQLSDAAGRILRVESPDRGTIEYAYDDSGRQIRREDAQGRVGHSAYDALGRLIERWDAADREGTSIRYHYDTPSECPEGACNNTGGVLVSVSYPYADGRARIWQDYDRRGRLTTVTQELGGMQFPFTIERDNLGRVLTQILPDGTRVAFTRDGAGRLLSAGELLTDIEYDVGGMVTEYTLANGVHEAWTRDSMDRLAQHRVTAPGDQTVLDLRYQHRRSALIEAIEDHAPVEGAPGHGARYTFDALYQLTEASLDAGRPFEEILSYGYDARHNLVEKQSSLDAASPAHVGALTYGGDGAGPHAVTRAGDRVIDYDAAGYITQRADTHYTWDWQGRLESARRNDAFSAQFSYGPNTRRVAVLEGAHRRLELSPHFEIEDGMTMIHLEFAGRRIATIESDSLADQVLSDVAPGALDDGTLTPAPDGVITTGDAVVSAQVQLGTLALDGQPAVSPAREMLAASVRRALLRGSTRTTFNHHDHYGNIVAITDEGGALVERRSHYPQGMVRGAAASGETTSSYNGKRTDPGTGLVYFGTRHHDASLGRWTAPDFRFERISATDAAARPREAVSSYLYNLNNPVTFQDPTGETAEGQPEPAPESRVDLAVANFAQPLQVPQRPRPNFGFSQVSGLLQQFRIGIKQNVKPRLEAANKIGERFSADFPVFAGMDSYRIAQTRHDLIGEANTELKLLSASISSALNPGPSPEGAGENAVAAKPAKGHAAAIAKGQRSRRKSMRRMSSRSLALPATTRRHLGEAGVAHPNTKSAVDGERKRKLSIKTRKRR